MSWFERMLAWLNGPTMAQPLSSPNDAAGWVTRWHPIQARTGMDGKFSFVVKEGEAAMLEQNGELIDEFKKAGRHERPRPTHGSIEKLVFVNRSMHRGLRWGTPQPLMVRDPEFGIVRLRAFGVYSMQIIDVRDFLKASTATGKDMNLGDVEEWMRPVLLSKISEALSTLDSPVLDLARKYSKISEQILNVLRRSMDGLGIEIAEWTLTSTSLPDEVQKALDDVSRGQFKAKWTPSGPVA